MQTDKTRGNRQGREGWPARRSRAVRRRRPKQEEPDRTSYDIAEENISISLGSIQRRGASVFYRSS